MVTPRFNHIPPLFQVFLSISTLPPFPPPFLSHSANFHEFHHLPTPYQTLSGGGPFPPPPPSSSSLQQLQKFAGPHQLVFQIFDRFFLNFEFLNFSNLRRWVERRGNNFLSTTSFLYSTLPPLRPPQKGLENNKFAVSAAPLGGASYQPLIHCTVKMKICKWAVGNWLAPVSYGRIIGRTGEGAGLDMQIRSTRVGKVFPGILARIPEESSKGCIICKLRGWLPFSWKGVEFANVQVDCPPPTPTPPRRRGHPGVNVSL